jgi:hypothetical protein
MENEIPQADSTDWREYLKGAFPIQWPDWPLLGTGPIPRELRNPHLAAHDVLSKLDNFAVEEWGFRIGQFTEDRFIPLWKLDANPDELRDKWSAQIKSGRHPSSVAAEIAAMMCASALRAFDSGKNEIAWTYAIDAEAWCGALFAGTTLMLGRETAISQKASQAAKSKNSVERAWVLIEWNNRKDKNQKRAAFAREFVQLVKKKFGVIVTTETISRDWLPKAKTEI